ALQMPMDEFEVPKSMPHASVMRHTPVLLVWRQRRSATFVRFSALTSLQFFLTPWCIQKIKSGMQGARARLSNSCDVATDARRRHRSAGVAKSSARETVEPAMIKHLPGPFPTRSRAVIHDGTVHAVSFVTDKKPDMYWQTKSALAHIDATLKEA